MISLKRGGEVGIMNPEGFYGDYIDIYRAAAEREISAKADRQPAGE